MTNEQIITSKQIRQTGVAEGLSYLVLLFVAMPLKYIWHIPEAVKYTGWIHGVLFIAFIFMIVQGNLKLNWGIRRMAEAFIASLVPFGTFWLDKKLKAAE